MSSNSFAISGNYTKNKFPIIMADPQLSNNAVPLLYISWINLSKSLI